MVVLQVTFHPLGTELALVDRELLPRFKTNHLLVTHLELDAALHAAKAAVGFDQAVGGARVPATRRFVMEVGAVLGDELFFGCREKGHGVSFQKRDENPRAGGWYFVAL